MTRINNRKTAFPDQPERVFTSLYLAFASASFAFAVARPACANTILARDSFRARLIRCNRSPAPR